MTPADVFRLYTDPATWSQWGHNATWARADGPLVEGATVHVRAGYGRVYECDIRRLVPDRVLELEARPPLIRVIQTYEVGPAPGGVRIRHALEISGPLSGPMRLFRVDRVYQGWLDEEVGRLIELAATTGRRDS